ncbi:hypothetical protein ACWT_1003 [Actinoplanes sp. SE50]|uniref:type 4a pilus biogenesis protein PilO n=1 Tax=unclassified Actinoplanes TaxID=2626549 RepID=UPI00023EC8E8|nr:MULTISPECIES: type 4a pilus biogenesis protein PilO [unclassified Actinoplanes]AEV82019.1 hypothetical protein ACPL_1122 [Actinoplanes sp. SE50/110]ATO80418.1 hypothetical protein ACWT_1003 [Actinoplanes sp. SE50]SLL97825.1 hypothetical protein ACSP50_1036 [Actinoplanes sp. SE50/110]
MNLLRSDRVWLFGGIGLIALLVAAAWFLPIKSQYTDAATARDQVGDATAQLAKLRKTLADLNVEQAKMDTYKANEARYKLALPTGDAIPAFLTQLQTMGLDLNVAVDAYSASGHDKSQVVPTVEELPITISATGSIANLSTFVNQLQYTQPRAVLIQTANLQVSTKPDKSTLDLTMSAFRNIAPASTAAVNTN